METSSRAEVMQPALLKVGISLAIVSVAGFFYAKIMTRKVTVIKGCSLETPVTSLKTISYDELDDEDSFHSLPSTCIPLMEDEGSTIWDCSLANTVQDLETGDGAKSEEILVLRSNIGDIEKREWELENQFIRYRDLKEQESLLMQLKNMLLLELARVEFLDREISSLETDKIILKNLVENYVGVLGQLEDWKSENRLLQRKVKKLLRRTRKQSRVIGEQNRRIEAGETAILASCDAQETRNDIIKKLEDKVKELYTIMDQMQQEKNELLRKIDLAETSASSISKIEGEGITLETYNQLVNELERLQKDREAEIKEVIFLRWSNACLRHQLYKKSHPESRFEGCQEIGSLLEHNEPACCVVESSHDEHAASKRGKLFQRIRRWVEGSEKAKGKVKEKVRQ
ncbi:protein CHUP1, chloroplastic isoform X1 [Carya illinoinensis]|nr:protein CHUP1, chloroplastic isoform X1 [Carya illinoinensis]